MKRKLNDEQRKIVEDNINLVYKFIIKHNLDRDEYLDVMFEAFCIAVIYHNPSKGALSTYAFKVMENVLNSSKREWCRFMLKCEKNNVNPFSISLDKIIYKKNEDGRNEQVTIGNTIPSKINLQESIETKLMFQQWCTTLTKTEKRLIRDFYDKTPIDIMIKKYGFGHSNISNYKRSLVNRFQRYMMKAERQKMKLKVKDNERTKILNDEELESILF